MMRSSFRCRRSNDEEERNGVSRQWRSEVFFPEEIYFDKKDKRTPGRKIVQKIKETFHIFFSFPKRKSSHIKPSNQVGINLSCSWRYLRSELASVGRLPKFKQPPPNRARRFSQCSSSYASNQLVRYSEAEKDSFFANYYY
ncbi:hypothetical protein AVEN_162680-1 [Araneus ventricosus]|uniref:Uncharacterized protein n=1 Tax=Araneus ventricosus TaxID=182803 RepID=A0A4Y2IDA2_ARAVE|nr:hypothetical protein AVEN_162680-1 [Araneus ventricosus]